MLHPSDFSRLNGAAKSIEADACQAFFSTRDRVGTDVAGALLILYLRMKFNPDGQWPAPEEVEDKVRQTLRENGILTEP